MLKILNFKDDILSDNPSVVRREFNNLIITKENIGFIKSIISILDLKEITVLKCHRVTYKWNNIKFEIDDYTLPKISAVAIEGPKDQTDKICKEQLLKIR